MTENYWWRVETAFAVAAVRTEQGPAGQVIVETPPIFRRWIGRDLWRLERAYNAQITAMYDRGAA